MLQHADGTDDSLLTVTIVDAAGKTLNNCPPVTLTIESGPGEFPTGPSITFAPDSDIAIRDGQAAISYRSYHAGKSVIRATSPGLKDAMIEITSSGAPPFIAGETPPVKPRPYVSFTSKPKEQAPSRFGLETPTRASSEAPDHSGRLANDGKTGTFWQAAASDPNAWLQVDLERIVTVTRTKLTFPTADGWRYKIELSDDGRNDWRPLIDQSQSTSREAVREDAVQSPSHGRFLRVTIVGHPAGQAASLTELEAVGVLK
jgi:hypothetical protein